METDKFVRVMVEFTELLADFKTQKLALEIEFAGDPATLNFEVSKLTEEVSLGQQRILANNNTSLEEWTALNEVFAAQQEVLQQYFDNNPDLQLRLNNAVQIISE